MNQNPLTNFEYMHYLIDETPSCTQGQVFVGWVKPFTAYPAKAAFWTAEVFPGLTMKNHVFTGRDTIEKDVGNASLIPTYAFLSHLMEPSKPF